MTKINSLIWFRQDLRVQDNPAFNFACEEGNVLCVYIWDDTHPKSWQMGGASKVWLHHSLKSLDETLENKLLVEKGDPEAIIPELVKNFDIQSVYWNRCYEPFAIERDKKIKSDLSRANLNVKSFNGSLLWEPWEISKNDGTPYKVFTPFYRKGCMGFGAPRQPHKMQKNLDLIDAKQPGSKIEKLGLIPKNLEWPKTVVQDWDISETGAHLRLKNFIEEGLPSYKDGRNIPAKPYISRLSPYLHFGLISPHQIWQAIQDHGALHGIDKNADHFLSELGWREFSYSLLYFNPDLPKTPIQMRFQNFPWTHNEDHLRAWQKGETGCPIVDAGMRELWQTGFMHNRVRMIVGSFLVKNLLIHWHEGEKWFWDCLFDADLANNSASWQWIAGCGADAAPYFRIFNPLSQAAKFDGTGEYIRKYVPEIALLPDKFLSAPWEAPELVLNEAGIELGKTYPNPIVDLKKSRNQALEAFAQLKKVS